MLLATLMAISTQPGIATAIARAILAPFIAAMIITTPTTIIIQDLKKLGHSYIAISLSASLPIKYLGNPT